MTRQLEFFFDCSSPWTYLAFHNIQPIARENEATIVWRPILVGGVFNAINPALYTERAEPSVPAKQRYSLAVLQDWTRLAGLRRNEMPSFHPASAVKIMRCCTALLGNEALLVFARSCFEAYFEHQEDISRDEVVAEICRRSGLDPDWLMGEMRRDEIKEQLRATTQELIDRGGFGSPTIFVGGSMYFGNDALPLVTAKLKGRI